MKKTKSADRIYLPLPEGGSEVITLGEALSRGLLQLRASAVKSCLASRARVSLGAYAGDVGWEIGRTLYLSRANEREREALLRLEDEVRRYNEGAGGTR